jgi:homoserine O-acetyltransferase/O-succinyltransferase
MPAAHRLLGYPEGTVTITIDQTTIQRQPIATPRDPFVTELGQRLDRAELAYETWGTLAPARDNAVLVTHALTGDSHVARHGADDQPGWWDGMVGPGRAIDTDRYFVICSNLLGGCSGSTGPRSINPETGRRCNLSFPLLTVRDLVRAQARLLDSLGISRLHTVVGGSLGGMQALEWAATFPDRVERVIGIGTAGHFSQQGIAFNEVQRRAIVLDPRWRNGEYEDGEGPDEGLAVARMLGVITYQSEELMAGRFDRTTAARYTAWPEFLQRYDIEGYLHYQGDKLVRRFDANSYLYLTRAMDSHDLGWKRESYEAGLRRIQARALIVGISSDILFLPHQGREVAERLRCLGRDAAYIEMESPDGHDAFLKDFDQLGPPVEAFLNSRD